METAETTDTTQKLIVMEKVIKTFTTALRSRTAINPREWMQRHALSGFDSHAGFISKRLFHDKPEEFCKELESAQLLFPNPKNRGRILFGANSITFPLKNKTGQNVNLFAINIESEKKAFLNEEGLYPRYPAEQTKWLYLTKYTLDAATIIECNLLKADMAVLALHEGKLFPQHIEAIRSLKNLQKIIVVE